MRALVTVGTIAVLLAGCGGGSKGQAPVSVVLPSPPVATKVLFSTFVEDAFRQDADAEPVEVIDDQLLFDVEDSPAAFDALIDATG